MSKTSSTAIILVIICTLFTSVAQLLYKSGANKLNFSDIRSILTNYEIGFGIILYGIAAILLIYAFKFSELSVIFPMIATSYVWVTLLAWYYFDEVISSLRVIGIIVIIIGVAMLGIGGNTEKHSTIPHKEQGYQEV